MKQVQGKRSVYAGALAGFLFVVFFVRPPWWLSHQLYAAFIGLMTMAFVFGGGWIGLQLYNRSVERRGQSTVVLPSWPFPEDDQTAATGRVRRASRRLASICSRHKGALAGGFAVFALVWYVVGIALLSHGR